MLLGACSVETIGTLAPVRVRTLAPVIVETIGISKVIDQGFDLDLDFDLDFDLDRDLDLRIIQDEVLFSRGYGRGPAQVPPKYAGYFQTF